MRQELPLNAKKIKKYRLAKGLTVIELAKKIKKTRTSVYNYEAGIQLPTAKALSKIAKVLGVKPIDLLGE
jgi:transcriptional regulator with XRE-family HTH domain